MTGLDRIQEEILTEARSKAAGILQEAQTEAQSRIDRAQVKAAASQEKAQRIIASIQQEKASRTESQAEVRRKNALLRARQDMIAQVLAEAREKVLSLDDASYFSLLLKLVSKHAQPDAGTLFLNEKDLSRVPAGFEQAVQKAAREAGGSLVLSKDPVRIDGGFVLRYESHEEDESEDPSENSGNEEEQASEDSRGLAAQEQTGYVSPPPSSLDNSIYGTVEENCSIQALFEEKQDEFSDLIRRILF